MIVIFLDNVVTSILVFEEGNKIEEYVGGFSDWSLRNKHLMQADVPNEINQDSKKGDKEAAAKSSPKKLSYMLQRELDELPESDRTFRTRDCLSSRTDSSA